MRVAATGHFSMESGTDMVEASLKSLWLLGGRLGVHRKEGSISRRKAAVDRVFGISSSKIAALRRDADFLTCNNLVALSKRPHV